MFTVISLMFAGIITGYIIKRKIQFINKVITVLIWMLLFILGIEVGSNRQIIESIATLGIEAIIITVTAVTGSCLAAWMLWSYLYRQKKGEGK